ncbi:MAG: MBL fold metallo-hydrolase, partial [Flavobacteriaceae bacterium]|nr:MBL fold metallo-hydrolase [Flavobacteriaceae bacterium]
MKTCLRIIAVLLFFAPLWTSSQNMDDVKIETVQLSDQVFMLLGRGGNIGVSVGEDGVFVVDDQFAPLSDKILTAIRTLSDQPLRFLANTHWHGDHTGGNANMAKAGATIMAHTNVRKRLVETPLRDNSQRPKEALPVITFNDMANLYLNGEHIAFFHVDNAHTDGDIMVYFSSSNVLHTGDNYFRERFPYIDLNSGGSIEGYIAAVERALMVIDEETKIIPGHGTVSNKAEYKSFLDMLKSMRDAVKKHMKAGKTEEEIVSDRSITQFYEDKGYGSGFINGERFRR